MRKLNQKVIKHNGGAQLLVVDDDPQVARLISMILREEGYEVTTTLRGTDAIIKAREDSPDLILLDVQMPGLDGLEATRQLKSDPVTRSIPIILITGLNEPDNKLRGLEAGADEFLPKPLDPCELRVRIRSMLRLKEYQEQLLNRSLSLAADSGAIGDTENDGACPRSVLVVLENPVERDLVVSGLPENSYRVAVASIDDDPQTLLRHEADVAIMDPSMPLQLLDTLRARTENLPTLAAVPPNDPELRVRLLGWGVSELLIRPFDGREVTLRVARLLRQRAELTSLEMRYKTALSAASNDSMTKLSNHGYFRKFLELEVKRSHRQNHPTSLIMLDIDDFKATNDSFGHATGDAILMEAAQLIRRSVREIDLAARYGGEEFAVVLPYTDRAGAAVVAERIRSAIASAAFSTRGVKRPVSVTASFGLAVCPDDAVSPEDLIRLADELLYRAKTAGKNRVCDRP
jgi:two-component system cell cycle response regulator